MKKETIWFINTCGPKNIGGGETAREQWSKAFIEKNYNVVWYYPQSSDKRLDQQNKVPERIQLRPLDSLSLPMFRRYPSPNSIATFMQGFKEEKPKAVILNGYFDFATPLVIGMLAMKEDSKVIQVFHGDPQPEMGFNKDVSFKSKIKALLRPVRDCVMSSVITRPEIQKIAVSNFVAQRVSELGLGSDIAVCYPPSFPDNCIRKLESGETKHLFEALTVSRISPEKGLDFLIDLAKSCREFSLPFIFSLVGAPSKKEYFAKISQKMDGLVRILGPKLGEDLCGAYNTADLGIMPSPNEGFGLVTIEHLEHGVPVLSINMQASKEIFSNFAEPPGILVDGKDKEKALRQSINFMRQFVTNHDLRKNLSVEAFRVRAKFDRSKLTDQFTDLVLNAS